MSGEYVVKDSWGFSFSQPDEHGNCVFEVHSNGDRRSVEVPMRDALEGIETLFGSPLVAEALETAWQDKEGGSSRGYR